MRIGTVCYATEQGLGYLAKSFYDAGVITDVMIFRHPHGDRPTRREWYPGAFEVTSRPFVGERVERFLDDLDLVLFFETPFDWSFLKRCRERGVPTVLVPMYEWFPERPPHHFDGVICPSLLDQDVFRAMDVPQYRSCEFVPIPVDPIFTWERRTIARKFLHNAGNIGSRNHKGTLELLRAMPLVKSPIQLTVRCQDGRGLRRLIDSAPGVERDSRIQFVYDSIPRAELFRGHDVYVAPEKYNGLSLPLQEAFQSGLAVMTTQRYPANTWLPPEPLIPVSGLQRVRVAPGHLAIDECVVRPEKIAEALDLWYLADVSRLSEAGRDWAERHSWPALRGRWMFELAKFRRDWSR